MLETKLVTTDGVAFSMISKLILKFLNPCSPRLSRYVLTHLESFIQVHLPYYPLIYNKTMNDLFAIKDGISYCNVYSYILYMLVHTLRQNVWIFKASGRLQSEKIP